MSRPRQFTGEILNPEQTVGLDSSMRYLAEARKNHGRLIEFKLHDVTQKLQVGAVLESCVKRAGWRVIDSSGPVLEKPAQLMAELHMANIRSWRHDKYASQSFDAGEMDLP
jgi:hypothetical protein